MSETTRFPELDRVRLVVRCAQLYHGLVPGGREMRQADVARLMGVPRSQVVLWLQEARERYLEIRLRAPRAAEMELPLERALGPFGVRAVRVVADGGLSPDGAAECVGAEAGRLLREALRPGIRVGLAGGRTLLAAVREALRGPDLPRIVVVPLAAGGSLPLSANALAAMLAGSAAPGSRAHGLWVPPLRSGRDGGELRAFLGRPDVRAVYREGQKADLVLLGVGAVGGPEGIRGMREYLGAGEAAARRMARSPARAFVLQQFVDARGRDLRCPLGCRHLAVPLDAIRRAAAAHPRRKVILAAAGPAKASALAAAVRGRLASAIVVDGSIGEALLEEFPT